MKEGKVECQGEYSELIQEEEFKKFVNTTVGVDGNVNNSVEGSLAEEEGVGKGENKFKYNPEEFATEFSDKMNRKSSLKLSEIPKEREITNINLNRKINKNKPHEDTSTSNKQTKLTKTERKETGSVSRKVFLSYFTSGGTGFFIFILILFMLVTITSVFSEYWISAWTTDKFSLSNSSYIEIYGGILAFMVVLNLCTGMFFGWYVVGIGFELFRNLLQRIIKKPMKFFDTTPIGQLLNLTGKDSDYVDTFLAAYTSSTIDSFMRLIGIFFMTGIANFLLIPAIVCKSIFFINFFNLEINFSNLKINSSVLLIVNFVFISIYLKVAQELRRLELMSSSPVISNIVQLYKGINILRVYNRISYPTVKYQKAVDQVLSVFLHNKYAVIFVYIINGVVMNFFILVAFLLICSSQLYKWNFMPQDIGFISLTLSWILIIPNFVDAIMYYYAEFNQSMSSVERMLFNVDSVTSEGPLKIQTKGKSSDVTTGCSIDIKNVFSRYRPGLPCVLKGLSLKIKKNQKVALVGRTGSGKSSVLLALTRMLNVENSKNYQKIKEYQQISDHINE
jgi:ABC-type multidrug transport system fused ATPase/permease subunit